MSILKFITAVFSFVFRALVGVRDFLLKWNETWLIAVLLMLWPAVQLVLLLFDATARVLDAGVLSIAYLAAIIFAGLNAFIWLGMRFNMRVIYDYFENGFVKDFNNLKPWDKIKYSLLFFLSFFALATATLIAVAMTAG